MVLATIWPAAAVAQPVFFDDFDGDALLPHWNQPPPSSWQYNVNNSMLNVTALLSPSSPHSPSNFVSMNAVHPALADFQTDVWMGWETSPQPHRLEVQIGGPFGGNPIIAQFGFRNEIGLGPRIIAGAGGQGVSVPAPPPGMQHFRLVRTAQQFFFSLNGLPLASFPDTFGTPAAAINFFFVGPFPGALGTLHVERVQVVPSPSTLVAISAVLCINTTRRRRAMVR